MDINNILDGPQGYYDFKKISISNGNMLYDSFYITFSKWQHYRDGEQINGYQGLGIAEGRQMGVSLIAQGRSLWW